jgi:uncharacterized protein DUF4258
MAEDRTLPSDPLRFIQWCVRARKILWTYHANMRLEERFIVRDAVLEAVEAYELIESYPEDKYLPSYLVRSEDARGVFHVLFAADVEGDNVRVVTAYRPNPEEWEDDLRTRRPRR